MKRTLFLGLAGLILAGCSRPTAPKSCRIVQDTSATHKQVLAEGETVVVFTFSLDTLCR